MTKLKPNKIRSLYLLLVLSGIVFFGLDLFIGSVSIPMLEIGSILWGNESSNEAWNIIIIESRLPKALAAVFCGIALSISGLKMQTLFRNPLAGPYLLGISSGAGLGVAIFVMGLSFLGLSGASFIASSGLGLIISAFVGAALIMLLLLIVIQRLKDIMTVLIVGIMLGSVITALIGVIQFFSQDYQLKSFVMWLMGDLNAITLNQVLLLAPIVLIGAGFSFMMSKKLNTLLLGEEQAKSLGTNLKQSRITIIVITSILTGGVTAFCGPIGFIGIIVPHLARMVSKSFDHKVLIPLSGLIGVNLLLVADIISQLPGLDERLPVNSITSLIGIPIILWIILKNKKLTQLN